MSTKHVHKVASVSTLLFLTLYDDESGTPVSLDDYKD